MRISDWSSDVCSSDLLRSFGVKRLNTGALKTTSYAAFAQLDARLSDQLTMSIGGRYTNEQRELTDGTTFTTLADGTVLGPIQGVLASMKALTLPTITQNKDSTGKFSLSWEIGRASCRERVCQYV